jgi:hypothetical protein
MADRNFGAFVWHQTLPIFHWTPWVRALTMRIARSDAEMRHKIAW